MFSTQQQNPGRDNSMETHQQIKQHCIANSIEQILLRKTSRKSTPKCCLFGAIEENSVIEWYSKFLNEQLKRDSLVMEILNLSSYLNKTITPDKETCAQQNVAENFHL